AALGALLISIMGALAFPVIAKLVIEENEAKDASAVAARAKDPDAPMATLEEPTTAFTVLAKLTAMTFAFGSASFLALVLAGLATVLLLVRSRTATFRQINANLLQIAEQLKRTPPATAGPAGS